MTTGFSVLSQQVNLFPARPILSDVGKLASKLFELSIFTGTPTILPINGPDFPSGVVVVSLKSKNGDLNCDISNDKISLTWLNIENKKEAVASSIILNILSRVVDAVFDASENYLRIGYITSIGKVLEKGPSEGISLIQEKNSLLTLPNTSQLKRFHAFLTYDLSLSSHSDCYNVITVGTVNKAFGNKEDVFAIQQDLSTKPNDNFTFKKEFINGFIVEAESISSITRIKAKVWES